MNVIAWQHLFNSSFISLDILQIFGLLTQLSRCQLPSGRQGLRTFRRGKTITLGARGRNSNQIATTEKQPFGAGGICNVRNPLAVK